MRKILVTLLIIELIGVCVSYFLKRTSIVKINSEIEEVEVFIKSLSKNKESEWINLGKTPIEAEIEEGELN
ncbi:MAG TPA: hypothetical protein PLK48_05495 [Caldisericia bacterium]|nr:hypothetical protein [Caldisericia bacterium]HPC57299.1 hypothetical protein [Caldisericia bacterium]HPP44051.1 hypothetical protein [Caldisericia bacterium]